MKPFSKLSQLRLLVGIFSVFAVLISVGIVVKAFINIQPSLLSLLVGVAGSIIGGILAYSIGWLSQSIVTKTIFISYSRKDSDFVSKLKKELIHANFQVFTLDSVVLVGDNIKDKVTESIQKSDFFVVVLSKDSVESSWVSSEMDIAIINNKKVFPVLIEKLDLPSKLESIQYADFTTDYDSAINKLIYSLRASPRDSKK